MPLILRTLVAVGGGYALAHAFAGAIAVWLTAFGWMRRADAVLLATMLSFAVYAWAALYSFAARTSGRAAIVVIGCAAGLALLASLGLQWL